MNSPQSEHLSADQLQAFVLGLLSLDEVAVVEEHLTECSECQDSLEQTAVEEDQFLRQLAQANATAQQLTPDSAERQGTIILPIPAGLIDEPSPAVRSGSEIDIECLRFRVDRMSGVGPNIEARLATFAEDVRPELLRRLLAVEMEELLRANLPVPVDDYLGRFPETQLIEQAYEQAMSRQSREATAIQHLARLFPKPFDAVGRFREYLFQSKIGEGGMGAVYKALHTRLERTVAFKVLSPDKVQSPDMIARFHREMKSVGKLEHPHIVRAHDAGDHAGCHFLVMEFVDGVGLDALVKRRGPLPVREACEIIRQAAIGLDHAHRHGLVHRDVKPSNLMIAGVGASGLPAVGPKSTPTASRQSAPVAITPPVPAALSAKADTGERPMSTGNRPALPDTDSMIHNTLETAIVDADGKSAEFKTATSSRSSSKLNDQSRELSDSMAPPVAALSAQAIVPTVKVLDLGLARLQSESQELTHESQVVGTLDYIAPEQARRGGNVDHRADIYSLGCTLFTLLAGRAPYGDASHASIAQKVMAHVEEPLPSISQFRADVPPRVVEILRRMTAKQPSQRFQSAAAVAEALTSFAQGANLRLLAGSDETEMTTPVVIGDLHVPFVTGTTIKLTDHAVRRRGLITGSVVLLILLGVGVWWSKQNSPKSNSRENKASEQTLVGAKVSDDESSSRPAERNSRPSDMPVADTTARDLVDRDETPMELRLIADNYELQFEPATSVIVDTLKLDPTASHTQEAWVTPTLLAEIKRPIHVFGPPQGSSVFLDDTSGGWAFGLSLDDGSFRHVASKPIERHQRAHVAVVRADHEMRLFVNGKLVSRRSEPGLPLMTPQKQYLIGNLFTGLMDEIRISSVARYEQDFTPQARFEPDAHTLALFHCDEGSGVALRDSSGHDHHGQIKGPASWHNVNGARTEWPTNLPPLAKAPFDSKAAQQHQAAWAKHLNMPEEIENSIDMKLRLIPPGEFLMGAPDDDADAQPAEKPQHKVRLTKPFLIGTTEVTVGQFRKFVDNTMYVTQAESDGKGAFDVNPQQRKPELVWSRFAATEEVPVRCISWEDAGRFCEWLSKQEGRTYRLPTDAEWEFACRAGTTTRYSFGNDFDHAKANASQTGPTSMRPVAQYPANPFGLFDMHGNAHEICWDGGRTFLKEDVVDPIGPVEQSRTVVVRGGASSASPARLRSSQRYINDNRFFPELNFATPVKGFRVVALVNAKPTELSATAQLTPSELLASPNYEWSPLEDLGEPINTSGGYEAGASIAADGLSLLFHGNERRPQPGGKLRLWQAWRHAVNDPFDRPVLLEDVINNQPDNLSDPTLTADGLTFAFCMNRPDGQGGFDLWFADRPSGDASWNAPINAGPAVNSNRSEWEPELSTDGLTLLFHSDRANENGGTDLWIARRDSRKRPFGPAENLGPGINADGHEGGAALSSDGLTLLFHRISANPTATLTHWRATRKSMNDPFDKLQPLVVPGLVENHGTSLNLSRAGDRLYCSTSRRNASPDIAVSRRVKRNAPPSK